MILSDALTEGQVALIMEKTEEILERTGLGVTHPALLARCRAGRGRVDEAEGRVRFPGPCCASCWPRPRDLHDRGRWRLAARGGRRRRAGLPGDRHRPVDR